MRSVIVGTAGHIDHGKTALVKALTGIDADRLEEEKRRGITIDIGFAHLELAAPSGEPLRIGFVDVPGHERFVRNMLAGIGGIDLVLLVISAEEGVKPQTREHFDICRLLSIRRGITVLTKADLVDSDTLDVLRIELDEFLRGSFLEGAPVVPVSSTTGHGLEELKRQLARLSADAPARDPSALFRLPVDRVFTMKGHGTVITGTLISGRVRKEDELQVFPSGQRVRVRGVQVHGSAAEEAIAGQRTALNLAGASVEDLARGMTLAEPGLLRTTTRADVELSLLGSARPLKDRARVHLHVFTSEAIAEISLFGQKELQPGSTGFARLHFAEPLLLLPGDRFIIRQFSPVVTIGGGRVLEAFPPSRLRPKEKLQPYLEVMARDEDTTAVNSRAALRNVAGWTLADAIAQTGWTRDRLEEAAAPLLAEGRLLRYGDVFVHRSAAGDAKTALVDVVAEFHQLNPLAPGMPKGELRGRMDEPDELFAAFLRELAAEGSLQVTAELVRLPGRGVEMKDEEAESKRQIEQAFATAGLKVPALKDVLAGLKLDRVRAQKIVTLLLRDRVLIKISDDLVFHRDALDGLRRLLAEQKAKSPNIDVARFKDLTGVSRKYAIPLLEWLDRERVTRRMGDERLIL